VRPDHGARRAPRGRRRAAHLRGVHAVRGDPRGGAMTAAAKQAEPADRWAAATAMSEGLAIAARSDGLTFIALPAPVAPAAAVIDALPDQPRVAWASGELTLVGVGMARELRGTGAERWDELVRDARELEIAGAVIAGEPAAWPALGIARPRWIGGTA